jgi:dihydrolipoamide dehydrogenase
MELQKPLKQKTLLLLQVRNHLLPFIKIDKERIITSTEALKLPEVPKHLVIIGGGVGIELGQVYLRLERKFLL